MKIMNLCKPCAEKMKADGKRDVKEVIGRKVKGDCEGCECRRYVSEYEVKRIFFGRKKSNEQ